MLILAPPCLISRVLLAPRLWSLVLSVSGFYTSHSISSVSLGITHTRKLWPVCRMIPCVRVSILTWPDSPEPHPNQAISSCLQVVWAGKREPTHSNLDTQTIKTLCRQCSPTQYIYTYGKYVHPPLCLSVSLWYFLCFDLRFWGYKLILYLRETTGNLGSAATVSSCVTGLPSGGVDSVPYFVLHFVWQGTYGKLLKKKKKQRLNPSE